MIETRPLYRQQPAPRKRNKFYTDRRVFIFYPRDHRHSLIVMNSIVKVALNMAPLPGRAKITKGGFILACLTGNSHFPTLKTKLKHAKAALKSFEKASGEAVDGGKRKTGIMHDKEKTVIAIFNSLAHDVEHLSGGDEEKIRSSGMDIKRTGGNVSVTNLVVKHGKESGSVNLRSPRHLHSAYEHQVSPDPFTLTSWYAAKKGTRANVTIKDLTPGLKYWFRFSWIDSEGEHTFSEPVSLIVT